MASCCGAASKNDAGSEPALFMLSSPAYPCHRKGNGNGAIQPVCHPQIMEQVRANPQSPDPDLRLNALHSALTSRKYPLE